MSVGQLDIFGLAGKSTDLPESVLSYHPGVFSEAESASFLKTLMSEIAWEQRSISMYGKQMLTPRLTAWYGEPEKNYAYSGNNFRPLPWTKDLNLVRQRLEPLCKVRFNSVLLNYYRDGSDSVAWHSDNERELGPQPLIASVSFGAVRQFDIRHKEDHQRKHAVRLESGSLLIMKGDLQEKWEHRIAKSAKVEGARINLTFRIIR